MLHVHARMVCAVATCSTSFDRLPTFHETLAISEKTLQEVIARVTADNLMLMLRAKSAETRADAAGAERDRLANAAAERRDPWLSHVCFRLTAFTFYQSRTTPHRERINDICHFLSWPRLMTLQNICLHTNNKFSTAR
jgi:hypothetical protein